MITIIIPTFNNGLQLEETLQSIATQNSDDWECIIVDDGSNDAVTHKVILSFTEKNAKFIFLKRPTDRAKGANACRNMGIENASGDYVMFLDADDLLSKDCISNRSIKHTTDAIQIFPMASFKSTILEDVQIVNRKLENDSSYLKMFLSYQTPWPITSLLIPKELLHIRFSENLSRFQDIDFSIRLILSLKENRFEVIESAPDSFYRRDSGNYKKFKDPQFILKVVSSFHTLLENLIPVILSRTSQDELKLLAKFHNRIFESYVRGNESFLNDLPAKIRSILYNHKIISNKERVIFKIKSTKLLRPFLKYKNSLKAFK